MRSVTVREVRLEFSRKVEAPLRRGETLVLRQRDKVLGHIVPERGKAESYPDFEARPWEDLPPEVWTRARELAGRLGPTLGCRAMELIHVACALCLGADDFFAFDQDQARLARAAGLHVLGA